MTSCLLAKAPDRIVAAADGRFSVSTSSTSKISLDTVQKILTFTPTYRIPQIDRGHFVRYSDRTSEDWAIAYAGNVGLASEIHRLFITRMTRGLFLTWSEGKPTLDEPFDEAAQYFDYDFGASDLIPLTPDIIVSQLKRITQKKADEFAVNRREFPDVEFLLFGRDETTGYWVAYKLNPNIAGWEPGQMVSLILDEIADGQLAAIGSPGVAGDAHGDEQLNTGLEGWRVNKSQLELAAFLDGFSLDDPSTFSSPYVPPAHDPKDWTLSEIGKRFVEHIRTSPDPSVGGDILIAEGLDHGELSLSSA